jgi:mono/diheme cytochrome c family protein
MLMRHWSFRSAALLTAALSFTACADAKSNAPAAGAATAGAAGTAVAVAPGSKEQVLMGRQLVLQEDCNGCHGGADPSSKGWLAGVMSPLQEFGIGACTIQNPTAKPCFITRPRNLTPDSATGLARFTERQIFNALRFGLRPEDTPDVEITSRTPGQGNFPKTPHYLAPPMPWPGFRHMSDEQLKAIAAYIKRGLLPFSNKVAESEGPPDFWASAYADTTVIGPYPARPFPAASEKPQP